MERGTDRTISQSSGRINMKEILDKVTSYNLFNYLLPGTLFVVILDKFTQYSFTQDNLIIAAFVYYFAGLIISRIGSLVIEPILKKLDFVEFAEYKDFVIASKSDSKLEHLSEANNMYRTFISMFVLLFLFKLYELFSYYSIFLMIHKDFILILVLLIMFAFSYRKQTSYIKARIESHKS